MKYGLYAVSLLCLLSSPALAKTCNEKCLLDKISKLEERLKAVENNVPPIIKRIGTLEKYSLKSGTAYRIKSERISPNGSCLTIDVGNGITVAGDPQVCDRDTQLWKLIPQH